MLTAPRLAVLAGCATFGALAAAAVAAAPAPAVAAAPTAPHTASRAAPRTASAEHVRARLVAETTALTAGATSELGILLELDEGWHVYAAARNDTGYPVAVTPGLPPGCSAEALRWPVPERHVAPGELLDHVYTERVLLLLPVRVPADARPGELLEFRARVEWLACREACVAGSADVALALPVAAPDSAPVPTDAASLFAASRARLPQPLPTANEGSAAGLTAAVLGDELRLHARGAAGLSFIPSEDCAELPALLRDGEAPTDHLTLLLEPNRPAAARVSGWVVVRAAATSTRFYALDLPAPPAPLQPSPPSQAGDPR